MSLYGEEAGRRYAAGLFRSRQAEGDAPLIGPAGTKTEIGAMSPQSLKPTVTPDLIRGPAALSPPHELAIPFAAGEQKKRDPGSSPG